MTPEGWEFLAAIRQRAPRAQTEVLAYSDWLEEQGRSDEAGLVRSAAAAEVRELDDGRTRRYVLRLWADGDRVGHYQPDHRVEEVAEVRPVVSPRTLRRKLQKKLKRKPARLTCPKCGRQGWNAGYSLVDMDHQGTALYRHCGQITWENTCHSRETIRCKADEQSCGWIEEAGWTGKPSELVGRRRQPNPFVRPIDRLLPAVQE